MIYSSNPPINMHAMIERVLDKHSLYGIGWMGPWSYQDDKMLLMFIFFLFFPLVYMSMF